VPKKLVRPKWEEVTGDWRKLQNKEAYDWHSVTNSSVKIEEDVMGGACGTYGDEGKIIHDSGGVKT